ncbi:MAG: hypothetical protein GOVbin4933_18 [Prokaryotic dsDNA virus sp.]|nr:MAG: hypothetical protein GOVbin4933_18 [Prokaryotic dsDNA virus sp.]
MPVLEKLTVDNQFPDYPTDTLPCLDGFEDCSWHNDTCPSWYRDNHIVWVDWPDNDDREVPGGGRFVVVPLDKDGGLIDEVTLETDDWNYLLAFFENLTNEGDPLGDHHGRNP